MSRHWVPDESHPVRAAPAPRDVAAAAEDARVRAGRARLSPGARAGLLLVAAACAGTVLGLHQMFGPADVFAEDVAFTD